MLDNLLVLEHLLQILLLHLSIVNLAVQRLHNVAFIGRCRVPHVVPNSSAQLSTSLVVAPLGALHFNESLRGRLASVQPLLLRLLLLKFLLELLVELRFLFVLLSLLLRRVGGGGVREGVLVGLVRREGLLVWLFLRDGQVGLRMGGSYMLRTFLVLRTTLLLLLGMLLRSVVH